MTLDLLGAAEAARRIARGEITSEALVAACPDRIAARDDAVRAWIWLAPGLALDRARGAALVLARGAGAGPWDGAPVRDRGGTPAAVLSGKSSRKR